MYTRMSVGSMINVGMISLHALMSHDEPYREWLPLKTLKEFRKIRTLIHPHLFHFLLGIFS